MAEDATPNTTATEKPVCFVIMPIGELKERPLNHFKRVYEDIFKPACEAAGYQPLRADDVRATQLIHVDILQRTIHSPMVLCDLSTRNPNVLFELGIRQSFDKPVTLVQETDTPSIFDIGSLAYTEYRKDRIFHEVMEDREKIRQALEATRDGKGVNSILKLLAVADAASVPVSEQSPADASLQLIRDEIAALRKDLAPQKRVVESKLNAMLYKELLDKEAKIKEMLYGDSRPSEKRDRAEFAVRHTCGLDTEAAASARLDLMAKTNNVPVDAIIHRINELMDEKRRDELSAYIRHLDIP